MADVEVYVERGATRAFAGALAWPGWCRSGKDEDAALDALAAYAPRYASAIKGARAGFKRTTSPAFRVVERLEGDSTTDFGAPGKVPKADDREPSAAELTRLVRILRAAWTSFDEGVAAATGATLRTGPRGGGRSLGMIVSHVCEGEWGYLRAVGGTFTPTGTDPLEQLRRVHEAFVDALERRARGELPDRGPRGGKRWTAPYAVRREAWHVLDHLWEIEDRARTS